MPNVRLMYFVTHPITALNLMRGQLAFMRNQGLSVFLMSAPDEQLAMVEKNEGVTIVPVPLVREIHLIKDVITLVKVYRNMKRTRPDIVNAGTPKAGLLGMIAAWLARVPIRIYTLRGLRLETKTGLSRKILMLTERIAASLAHQIICVSDSLKARYAQLGLAKPSKIKVLGPGSSNGIDAGRFAPRKLEDQEVLRKSIGIPPDVPVIGFVGRLTQDKGVRELLESFEYLRESFTNLYLLIVGHFEDGDPIDPTFIEKLQQNPQIVKIGFVSDPAPYYGLMDVFVFASHREGFPNAPLEAAASGVPAVGFRVTGVVDAIQDGVTGMVVPKGDVKAMAEAIAKYLGDRRIRDQHGAAAQQRVIRLFQQENIWRALHQEYLRLMLEKEIPSPDSAACANVIR